MSFGLAWVEDSPEESGVRAFMEPLVIVGAGAPGRRRGLSLRRTRTRPAHPSTHTALCRTCTPSPRPPLRLQVLILVLNAAVGVWQESNAENALEALKEMTADTAKVFRDGQLVRPPRALGTRRCAPPLLPCALSAAVVPAAAVLCTAALIEPNAPSPPAPPLPPQISDLPARELLPGDVVEIHTGDKVPADIRVVQLKTAVLRVEQAALTGESVAVAKTTAPVADEECELQVRGGATPGWHTAAGRRSATATRSAKRQREQRRRCARRCR